ncbi:MAG: orotidine-5'-phosphate decarboxylase [Deltaproteobacteria bacterium]|nr:orotidine-5'-phosphate decarboxylase [Deltaproteobacteria bacterium]
MQVPPLVAPTIHPRDRLAFALDVERLEDAQRWVEQLMPHVGVFKVGLELFVRHGPAAVHVVQRAGARCFLDLKLHDISETVARAVRAAGESGADFLTLHASGGRTMLERAVQSAPTHLRLLAVTVLTSLDERALHDLGLSGGTLDVVARWALVANSAGIRGLVCSAHEVGALRVMLPDTYLVTPGIRPTGGDAGDQVRTATVRDAVSHGADLLVVGRPIRNAQDPVDAARRIVAEIEEALDNG